MVGLKPSFGRVPYFPSSAELLSHVGPLTRTIDDAVLALDAMAGPDPRDPFSWWSQVVGPAHAPQTAEGPLHIALIRQIGETTAEPRVLKAIETAAILLEHLDHRTEEVPPLPDPHPSVEVILSTAEAAGDGHHLEELRGDLDPGRVAVIERGLGLSAVTLATAEEARFSYGAEQRRRLGGFDLLLTPSVSVLPFPTGSAGGPAPTGVVDRLAGPRSATPSTSPVGRLSPCPWP